MRMFALAAVVFGLAAGPAVAAPPAWRADMAASRLGFSGAMNGQAFKGAFGRWDVQITFDPNDLAASHVKATIDMASARTGDQTRDEALPTSDWFAAKAYPRATFVSRSIAASGPGRYVAQGDLTIRGVTRPVSLPFTLAINGDLAKMTGSTVLDRSAFGVGQGQWRGGEAVSLKVRVDVTVVARRGR